MAIRGSNETARFASTPPADGGKQDADHFLVGADNIPLEQVPQDQSCRASVLPPVSSRPLESAIFSGSGTS